MGRGGVEKKLQNCVHAPSNYQTQGLQLGGKSSCEQQFKAYSEPPNPRKNEGSLLKTI